MIVDLDRRRDHKLQTAIGNRSALVKARNYSSAGDGSRISTVVPLFGTLAIEIFP
jgi:hypothetical protein